MQLDLGVVLFQIGFGGGAGNDNHLIVSADFVQRFDDPAVRGDDTQRHVHVRQGKVHFLRPLGGDGEVGQNDVHLPPVTGDQLIAAFCAGANNGRDKDTVLADAFL